SRCSLRGCECASQQAQPEEFAAVGWTAKKFQARVVRKRDGREVDFDRERISRAIAKAFLAQCNLADRQELPPPVAADIAAIVERVDQLAGSGETMSVEQIQDVVEIELMQRQHYRVARRYIL